MTDPRLEAERIVLKVINLITTPNILVETFQESLENDIEQSLTRIRQETIEECAKVVEENCKNAIGTCEDMAGCHEEIAKKLRELK